MDDLDLRIVLLELPGQPRVRWTKSQVSLLSMARQNDDVEGFDPEVLRNVLSIAECRSWRLLAARHEDSPPKAPFRPGLVWNGPSPARSMGPNDLSETERDEIRRLAELTRNPFVCAFCYDLLWENGRRHDDARRSLSPRLDAAACLDTDANPSEVGFQLGRAFQLAAQLGDRDALRGIVAAIESTLTQVCDRGCTRTMAHLLNVLGEPWARGSSRDQTRCARILGSLVVGVGKEVGENDPTGALNTLEIAEGFAKASRLTGEFSQLRRRRLELLELLASATQGMMAAHWAREARILANDLGDGGSAARFAALARARANDAERDMVTVQTTFEIPAAAVEPWERLVRDAASTTEAIRRLATIGSLLEVRTPEDGDHRPGEALDGALPIPVVHLRDGKIVSRSETGRVGSTLQVQHALAGIASKWLRERSLSADDLLAAVGAPWQSESHAAFMRRAADAMIGDDFVSAISLAVPRYEAMVREALGAAGEATMKTRESDGTERDVLLTALLDHPWVVATLGADHVHFVRHFLAEPSLGRNLRNELAHGTLRPAECDSGTALLVWLLFVRLVESVRRPDGVQVSPRP